MPLSDAVESHDLDGLARRKDAAMPHGLRSESLEHVLHTGLELKFESHLDWSVINLLF